MLLSTAACHHLVENENVPGPALLFPQMKQASDLQSDFKTINLKRVLRLVLLVFRVPSVAKDSSG